MLPKSALQGISVWIPPWLTKQELGRLSAGICSVEAPWKRIKVFGSLLIPVKEAPAQKNTSGKAGF